MKLVFFLIMAAFAMFVAAVNCDLWTPLNPEYESSTAKAVFAVMLCLHWLIKAGGEWPGGDS